MFKHEQVHLPHGVEVDAGIAALLNALWDLGLQTSYSCQGTPDASGARVQTGSESYILFPGADDAWTFFAQTLEKVSVPDRIAKIDVTVHFGSKFRPGAEPLKTGSAMRLELTSDPFADGPRLRGCVRFDPDLMPQIEAAFASDGEPEPER